MADEPEALPPPPVQRYDPTELTNDALKSSDSDLLAALQANTRRSPGRPAGSKNRPAMDRTTGRLSGAGIRQPNNKAQEATDPATVEKARKDQEKSNELKKKRSEEWAEKIVKDGNEAIAKALQEFGVPPQFIYTKPPEPKIVTGNYTPWMNRIAVQPFTAKVLGYTMAELESTDVGGKASAFIMKDSPIRLAILVIASVGAVGYQVKNIIELRRELQPVIEAFQEHQRQQAQRQATEAAQNG